MGIEADCREEMTAAGMSDIKIVTHAESFEHPSYKAYWESMEKSMAPIVLLKHKMADEFEKIRADALIKLREILGEGPVSVKMTALLSMGTRG